MELDSCRLLIVEDDPFQASNVRELLEAQGARVGLVSGKLLEIRQIIDERSFNLILLDIVPGPLNSLQLARDLVRRCLPFLFVTRYDPQFIPQDLRWVPLVRKPVDPGNLLTVVGRLHRRCASPSETQSGELIN